MSSTYDFDKLELIKKYTIGPLNLEEWLAYNSENKLTNNEKLSNKMIILTNYPRFLDIKIDVSSYKKNADTCVNKISYEIRHKIVEKEVKVENVDKLDKNINTNMVENGWRSKSNFKLYNISESSLNRVRQNDMIKCKSVEKPKNKKEYHNLNTLVVRNVPQNIKINELENMLQNIFVQFGDIYKIKILNNKTHNSRGLAFIDFRDKLSVENALKFNTPIKIGDCTLNLERKNSTKERKID